MSRTYGVVIAKLDAFSFLQFRLWLFNVFRKCFWLWCVIIKAVIKRQMTMDWNKKNFVSSINHRIGGLSPDPSCLYAKCPWARNWTLNCFCWACQLIALQLSHSRRWTCGIVKRFILICILSCKISTFKIADCCSMRLIWDELPFSTQTTTSKILQVSTVCYCVHVLHEQWV